MAEVENGRMESPLVVGIGGTLRDGSRSLAALKHALSAAEAAGARTKLLALNKMDLPLFRPGLRLDDYPSDVQKVVNAAAESDGLLWSTAGYHGTLAGVTKNALDYLEFLSRQSYLDGRPVGLISVAGGDMAAVNAIDAMVHTVHALRGNALSLKVPIGGSRSAFSPDGEIVNDKARRRLEMLGELVAEEAGTWAQENRAPHEATPLAMTA